MLSALTARPPERSESRRAMRRPERQDPLVRRVLRLPLLRGPDPRLGHQLRRREVGLARPEVHHVDPLGLEARGLGGHGERGAGRQRGDVAREERVHGMTRCSRRMVTTESIGSAVTVPRYPRTVSALNSELTIASSVASTTASNSGEMLSPATVSPARVSRPSGQRAAPHRRGRGEGEGEVSAAVGRRRAGARHAQERAAGQALETERVQRRVGRHDDHDGAVPALQLVLQVIATQLAPDRRAADGEDAAEVGLHQHAHGPAAERGGEPARGGADPSLPAEGDRAAPGADAPLLDRPLARAAQRLQHVRLRDRPLADVVQVAVVRLAHHDVHRLHVLVPRERQQPAEDGVRHARDAQRAGQDDRRLQLAQLPDLRDARELAEAVPHRHRGRDLFLERVAAVREDRGHAGVDRVARRSR